MNVSHVMPRPYCRDHLRYRNRRCIQSLSTLQRFSRIVSLSTAGKKVCHSTGYRNSGAKIPICGGLGSRNKWLYLIQLLFPHNHSHSWSLSEVSDAHTAACTDRRAFLFGCYFRRKAGLNRAGWAFFYWEKYNCCKFY